MIRHKWRPLDLIKVVRHIEFNRMISVIKGIIFQMRQCDRICLRPGGTLSCHPQDLVHRIVCHSAHMGFGVQHNLFHKPSAFFVDHIDHRIMCLCLTISTDQNIILCKCKSLWCHGCADFCFSVPFYFQRPCWLQSRHNISPVVIVHFGFIARVLINSLIALQRFQILLHRVNGIRIRHLPVCLRLHLGSVLECVIPVASSDDSHNQKNTDDTADMSKHGLLFPDLFLLCFFLFLSYFLILKLLFIHSCPLRFYILSVLKIPVLWPHLHCQWS